MILELTEAQVVTLRENSAPGRTLLCRIAPETFDGTNAATSGRLRLEFGSVPTGTLPALREAILKANKPKKRTTKKPNENRDPARHVTDGGEVPQASTGEGEALPAHG